MRTVKIGKPTSGARGQSSLMVFIMADLRELSPNEVGKQTVLYENDLCSHLSIRSPLATPEEGFV